MGVRRATRDPGPEKGPPGPRRGPRLAGPAPRLLRAPAGAGGRRERPLGPGPGLTAPPRPPPRTGSAPAPRPRPPRAKFPAATLGGSGGGGGGGGSGAGGAAPGGGRPAAEGQRPSPPVAPRGNRDTRTPPRGPLPPDPNPRARSAALHPGDPAPPTSPGRGCHPVGRSPRGRAPLDGQVGVEGARLGAGLGLDAPSSLSPHIPGFSLLVSRA